MHEPDAIDLRSWIVFADPNTYDAIRYLHEHNFREIALTIWRQHGYPDISMPADCCQCQGGYNPECKAH